ncbi:MAG: hypothetical protein QOE36_1740, partial [Gaiellaceae bacterium]|nr:hypothetical protein [Gaiellaceae bacterium]
MRLDKPRIRLDRATAHKARSADVWNAFIEKDDAYPVFVRIDDNGEGRIYADPPVDFPGDELSLEFGEMLYQLRAALDSLVYEVAILDCGQNPPPGEDKLEFVVRDSEANFANAAWHMRPLSDQHREMIKSIQPYHAEYDNEGMKLVSEALNTLNDWARKDRHRGLRVLASWGANKNPLLDHPPECRVEWIVPTPDGLLEYESEIAHFKLSGWERGMEAGANP